MSFARDDVAFAVDDYEIEYAIENQDQLIADAEAAASRLEEEEVSRYPQARPPAYSATQAYTDIERLRTEITGAITAYEAALSEVRTMVAKADSIL